MLVKSDAAIENTGVLDDLGWHREPSLENKWPHNTIHERWHATYKSVVRACMLQSGFPSTAWDLVVGYAAIALSVTQTAPILPWEKDAGGNVLDDFKQKASQNCWEAHHGGQPSEGFVTILTNHDTHSCRLLPLVFLSVGG